MRIILKFSVSALALFLFFISQPPAAAPEASCPFTGTINADDINIRSDSSVSSEVVCKINKGQHVRVLAELYEWYKISIPDFVPLFIHKNMASPMGDKSARVTADNVNIRLRPDTKSAILGKVNKNDLVHLLSIEGEWYKIKPVNSSFAWINKKFISMPAEPEAITVPGPANRPLNIESTPEEAAKKYTEPDKIEACGIIKPKVMRQIATHKLISDNNKIFLLKSASINLDNLRNQRVKVVAREAGLSGKNLILEIEKAEILD